jgi:phosphoglycolate phosphatase-like HAD superfamily hydrolase
MYTVAAAYGYIEEGDDPHQRGADGVIERPAALIAWLDEVLPAEHAGNDRRYLQS